jgi:hypothetical protein
LSGQTFERIETLLVACLEAWRVTGEVRREESGAIVLTCNGKVARIEPPPTGLPFRYMLVTPERTRGLTSIAALLRAVRTLIEPDYRAAKVRIAPHPVVPPS